MHGFVKCPDGRVNRNQDAFEPHSVLGIHLVVPLLEPREQVEQEIRRSLGTSSLPRRPPPDGLIKVAAAEFRRHRPVAQLGFLPRGSGFFATIALGVEE